MTVSTGIITIIAGVGSRGYYIGEIAASDASLYYPFDVALDGSGNVYIAEFGFSVIRKLTVSTGIITTIAGTGSTGTGADGIMATSSELRYPRGVALDVSSNVYISDTSNHKVRKVTVSTGIITTIAGTGDHGYNSDDIMATAAQLDAPVGLAFDGSGNVYIADANNNRIRKVTVSTGIITTIAGGGFGGFYGGNDIMATDATLSSPKGVAVDGEGNVYIADSNYHRVKIVMVSTGMITTIAGTGNPEYNGDFMTATDASLKNPHRVALDV